MKAPSSSLIVLEITKQRAQRQNATIELLQSQPQTSYFFSCRRTIFLERLDISRWNRRGLKCDFKMTKSGECQFTQALKEAFYLHLLIKSGLALFPLGCFPIFWLTDCKSTPQSDQGCCFLIDLSVFLIPDMNRKPADFNHSCYICRFPIKALVISCFA